MPGRIKHVPKGDDYTQLDALVEKVIQGDSTSFDDLCGKISNKVLCQASYSLATYEDAEDVAQEVLLKVWKNIYKLREPKAFRKWLNTIISNTKNNHLAKNIRHSAILDIDDYLERLLETRSEYIPTANFENTELCSVIQGLIVGLPERQKKALVLRYYSELSFPEIAEVMGVTRQTASRNATLASKKIRGRLEKHPVAAGRKLAALRDEYSSSNGHESVKWARTA